MMKSAVIDPTGKYRYLLRRIWGDQKTVLWVMLNPSTADAEEDDPTIRRCLGFTESLGYMADGYGGLEVVNLFAVRSTDPKWLSRFQDPVGPENDDHIAKAAARAGKIIVAWGSHDKPFITKRIAEVLLLLNGHTLYCLDLTNGAHPRHPLYCRSISKYPVWRKAGA